MEIVYSGFDAYSLGDIKSVALAVILLRRLGRSVSQAQ